MAKDPITLDAAERMLSYVRGVETREIWVKMAYILRDEFGDAAFDTWDHWSQGAPNYNAKDARDVWKSCKGGSGNRATIGTLIALAKDGGYRPTAKDRRPIDPQEAERLRQERQARIDAQAAKDEQQRQACAAKAEALWKKATEATQAAHPYLGRKQITGIGARVLGETLLIPMRHGPKELVGLQVIQPDGSRKFLSGTPAAGAYMTIGKASETVVICEGYATGASIHEATGLCVVVAFSAGNLATVAAKIRERMPAARIIIAADDDHATKGNPGITAARKAAEAIGAKVALPSTADDRAGGTDFNDLHCALGRYHVELCFEDDRLLAPGDLAEPEPPAEVVVQPATKPKKSEGPVSDLPVLNAKMKPRAHIDNVREICRRLGVTVRYNVISKQDEILIPGESYSVDNRDNSALTWMLSECTTYDMPVERVPEFLAYLADQNQYNPVATWITSRPWDGKDRLQALCGTIRAIGEHDPQVAHLKCTLLTRWLISAVAAAFEPNGISAHGVLVLQGAQGSGKTSWFKRLAPPDLGVLKDGVLLRPDDRDSVMRCISHWLVELGELDATFRKADVAALKSFITSDRDILRKPYARKESTFARRTVFFASVNPKNYLHDDTGNRRYWTIEVDSIDYQHNIDMQQLWAQIYEQLYKPGEPWTLRPDELAYLENRNEDFTVLDPIEELITSKLDWQMVDTSWSWSTPTEVLIELGKQNPTKAEATKAAIVIRRLNGGRSKKSKFSRFLLVPQKKS